MANIVKVNSKLYLNTDRIITAELKEFHEFGRKWKWDFSIQERKENIYSDGFDNRGGALSWFFSVILGETPPSENEE